MITMDVLEAQLKKVDFNINGWGRTEAKELINILHEHEEILDLVNGYYEGGFALLAATNIRLILVDKKPLNYLTVEDLRFDTISEIQFNNRLIGAHINVASGNNKIMRFTSLNQQRLRKTIGHVQHLMAMAKKSQSEQAEDQKGHLSQINQQLQSYLLAQHQQQLSLKQQLDDVRGGMKAPEEISVEQVKPSHELSDFLFAQSLLAKAKQDHPELDVPAPNSLASEIIHTAAMIQPVTETKPEQITGPAKSPELDDLYSAGIKEVFGSQGLKTSAPFKMNTLEGTELKRRAKKYGKMASLPGGVEINPFRVAYKMTAKAMKKRKTTVYQGEAYQPSKSYETPPSINNPSLHLPV